MTSIKRLNLVGEYSERVCALFYLDLYNWRTVAGQLASLLSWWRLLWAPYRLIQLLSVESRVETLNLFLQIAYSLVCQFFYLRKEFIGAFNWFTFLCWLILWLLFGSWFWINARDLRGKGLLLVGCRASAGHGVWVLWRRKPLVEHLQRLVLLFFQVWRHVIWILRSVVHRSNLRSLSVWRKIIVHDLTIGLLASWDAVAIETVQLLWIVLYWLWLWNKLPFSFL